MKADNFVLQEYFDRIGYQGQAGTSLDILTELMRHQLFTVPFENLDVQAGKIVSLIPEDIVDKIVGRRRGGYCFEVNGLFAMALEALGIPYRFVAARPMVYRVRKPKTHMAIIASMDGMDWLCDLGFGNYGIRAPLRMDILDTEIRQDHDAFMLSLNDRQEHVVKALVQGAWTDQFGFDLSPQEWVDFAPANYFCSTHPDAIFVQKTLVILQHPQGRDILFGDTYKTVTEGHSEKRVIGPQERDELLRNRFGLEPH